MLHRWLHVSTVVMSALYKGGKAASGAAALLMTAQSVRSVLYLCMQRLQAREPTAWLQGMHFDNARVAMQAVRHQAELIASARSLQGQARRGHSILQSMHECLSQVHSGTNFAALVSCVNWDRA